MPTTIQTTVYAFDELSDPAKETARAWHRETGLDHAWHEFVYADFEAVCAILGVNLRTSPVRLMGGGSRPEPHIFFRGFWSQGDGACFEGAYAYERRARTRIKQHAPQDPELHRIADILQTIQRRNFYQLRAEARHRGHCHHEHSMAISVERDSPGRQDMTRTPKRPSRTRCVTSHAGSTGTLNGSTITRPLTRWSTRRSASAATASPKTAVGSVHRISAAEKTNINKRITGGHD
jgi:hypothetical protein